MRREKATAVAIFTTSNSLRERRLLPAALMDRQHRYVRVLRAAAMSLGGEAELAGHLGVSSTQLARWVSGADPAPFEAFLAGLDFIAHGRLARNRRIRVAVLPEREAKDGSADLSPARSRNP